MKVMLRYQIFFSLLTMVIVSFFSICFSSIDFGQSELILISKFMMLLSFTSGPLGFVLTIAGLCYLVSKLEIKKLNKSFILLNLFFLLLMAFIIKTPLKDSIKSPRPYVESLVKDRMIKSTNEFYLLSQTEKNLLIDNSYINLDPSRSHEWKNESDYSFPSGHMLFSSVCIIFLCPIFLFYGHKKIAFVISVWGASVGGSRIWLGMHFIEDLYASIFISFMLILTGNVIKKWLMKNKFIFNKLSLD